MSLKLKNRYRLKSKDIRKVLDELHRVFDCSFFDEKTNVEKGDFEGTTFLLIDGEPDFMYNNGRIFFTLSGLDKFKPRNQFVVVDMGAVKFVTNGADVMAPGIVDADINIEDEDQVWVCDERHRKPLAVGIAVMNGDQMINEKKGKAVAVVHYVGDELWKIVAKSL
jgi:PUA domain protein